MEARSNTDEEEEEEEEGTTQEPSHFGLGFWMGPGVPPRNHLVISVVTSYSYHHSNKSNAPTR